MKNYENILSDELVLGINVTIHPSAMIRGTKGNAKKIIIGDNSYIGENVQILVDDTFSIGDYSKIHHHVNIHGYKSCSIGHNAWIGQYTLIDCIGGVEIGNNFGVGAQSQLWSHIKYGDTLEGCRFLSEKKLIIKDDVWLVGHCIVSPTTIYSKAMALTGSVITHDMDYNTIYAGVPAKAISDKVGRQFDTIDIEKKFNLMEKYLKVWSGGGSKKIKIVTETKAINFKNDITYFNVSDRCYTKKRTPEEIGFMHYLLPEKGKFIPYDSQPEQTGSNQS